MFQVSNLAVWHVTCHTSRVWVSPSLVISPHSPLPADSHMSSGVIFLVACSGGCRRLWEARLRPEAGVGACWEARQDSLQSTSLQSMHMIWSCLFIKCWFWLMRMPIWFCSVAISSSQLWILVASKLVRATGSITGTWEEVGGSRGGSSPLLEVVSSLGGGLVGPKGQRCSVFYVLMGPGWLPEDE